MSPLDVVFRDESITVCRRDVAWSSKDGRFIAARVGLREVGRTYRWTDAYTAIDTVEGSVLYPWHGKREAIADAKRLAAEVSQ
jgi:hypothetical protein